MKDEEAEQPEPSEHGIKIARPTQTIQVINKVVSVLYNYKRPVLYKDIATACGMHPVNVSQALSAAYDIGLTQLAGKKGLHALTNDGREYVLFLSSGKENDAKRMLGKLLEKNPLWSEILTFLNATRGQSRNASDLVLEIERKAGKHWKPSMRSRLRDSLISILEFANFVMRDGSSIVPIPPVKIPKPDEAYVPTAAEVRPDFLRLAGDDFTFEVRNDPDSLEFAESQFRAWIDHLKKKQAKENESARQSGGVPNQQQ